MKNKVLKKTVLSALFLAVGVILPIFTGQIRIIGNMLCPMHIPVMLCGLICGGQYGLLVGIVLPLFRSLIFSMPPIYPNALAMSAELATYGLVTAVIYSKSKKNTLSVIISLLVAMLSGRIVWGIAETVLLGISGNKFSFSVFMANGFVNSLPAIILQLILIPIVMKIYNNIFNK